MTRGKAVLVPALIVVFAVTSGGWLLQRGVGMRASVYLHARVFEEVLERIEGHFVGEVDVDDLYEAAIAGVVDRLGDPNSQFLPASRWEDERIRTQGEYGGVGLEVADRDGYITVVAPIPGTPGARAGLRPGDRIVEVDGRSVEGWLTDQAVDLPPRRTGHDGADGHPAPGCGCGHPVRRDPCADPCAFGSLRDDAGKRCGVHTAPHLQPHHDKGSPCGR